jgi:uncharacterized protein
MNTIYQSSTIFTAILFEAFPFLLMGSLVSAAIEVYVPRSKISALFSHRWYGIIVGTFGGFIFPTCECASIPITNRLIKNGASPGAAAAFLYAAPVLNPLVIASTYIAFRGDLTIVLMRVVIVGATAVVMGVLLRRVSPEKLLAKEPVEHNHNHDHDHSHAESGKPKIIELLVHMASDFVSMSIPFLLGAFFVIIFRGLIGFGIISTTISGSFLIIPAMMLLAILLSVCSEADAFLAASLQRIPVAGQLAFITIGPMVDIKLILQYRRYFNRAYHPVLIGVPVSLVLLFTTLIFFVSPGGV